MAEEPAGFAEMLVKLGQQMYEAGRTAATLEHHYTMAALMRSMSEPQTDPPREPSPPDPLPDRRPPAPPLSPGPPAPPTPKKRGHIRQARPPLEGGGQRAAALERILAILPPMAWRTPQELGQALTELGHVFAPHAVNNALRIGVQSGKLLRENGRYQRVTERPPGPQPLVLPRGRMLPSVLSLMAVEEPRSVASLMEGIAARGEPFTEDSVRHLLSDGVQRELFERVSTGMYQRSARLRASMEPAVNTPHGDPPAAPVGPPHLATEQE